MHRTEPYLRTNPRLIIRQEGFIRMGFLVFFVQLMQLQLVIENGKVWIAGRSLDRTLHQRRL
jgi:hypothetical protein